MNSTDKRSISINDVKNQVRYLLVFGVKNLKTLLVAGLLGLILGVGYAFISKPTYTSFLSFLINENESSPINLSSIAGLAGIGSIGGASVNEDKLMFLTTSRQIIGSALLTKHGDLTVADRFIQTYEMDKSFKSDTILESFVAFKNYQLDSLTYQENKVIDRIIKFLTDSKLLNIESKKKAGLVAQNSGIVSITFLSKNEELSKLFVEDIYSNLSVHYVNKTIQRHLRNYHLIKHRADSIKEILSYREQDGAQFIDQNLNISKMVARVKVERTRRDLEMLNLMYGEVLKNLEIAKFSLENQTPLLQVVDHPTYPLKEKRASKIIFGIIGAIVLGMGTFMFLLIRHYSRNEVL
jgi:LPS O-antigen subunit length determinant protein (WzzB/FepE family)